MVILFTTVQTRAAGRKLIKKLLDKKLVACVSLSSEMESYFTWKGKRQAGKEFFCWIKTTQAKKKQVMNFLAKEHPYEIPEIVALSVTDASLPYLKWVKQSVK